MIELLISLSLLVLLSVTLGRYQLQIGLYKKLATEVYAATNLCEDWIEEIWGNKRPKISQIEQIGIFKVSSQFTPGPENIFFEVKIKAEWTTPFNKLQTLSMDAICIN